MMSKAGGVAVVLLLVGAAFRPGVQAFAQLSGKTSTQSNTWAAAAKFVNCQQAAVNDSAYLIYPLANTSGTTSTETSGAGRANGTYQGGFTLNQSGPCSADTGAAVSLNGSTGWISSNQQTNPTTTFTEEIWFKTATSGYASGGGLIGYGNQNVASPTGWDQQIYMSNTGILNFGVSTSSSDVYISSTATFNDGNWHLMDATLSSAGQKLYVDGTLVASGTQKTTNETNLGYWRMGTVRADGPNAPSSNYFKGSLAFASIYYNTALSTTQISNHYAAGS